MVNLSNALVECTVYNTQIARVVQRCMKKNPKSMLN